MKKRKILIEPDPLLRKKCEPLEKVDDDLRKLMNEMLATMYDAPGIGLAAIQVGVLKRVVVIDLSKKAAKELGFLKRGVTKVRVEILEEESRELALLSSNDFQKQVEPAKVKEITKKDITKKDIIHYL